MKKLFNEFLILIGYTRSLSQLYSLLYDEIKHKPGIYSLCSEIVKLRFTHISNKEYGILMDNFVLNKPKTYLHIEFYNNSRFTDSAYWWNDAEDSDPVNRKAFIKYLIKNHIK